MNPIFNTMNCTEPGEETTFWDNLSYKRLFSWLEPVTREQDHSHQAGDSLVLHWGTCSSLQLLQACACVCETRARMEWRLRRTLASCDRKRERAPRSAALQNKRCKYQFFSEVIYNFSIFHFWNILYLLMSKRRKFFFENFLIGKIWYLHQ